MNLHLGCGTNRLGDGWINIDFYEPSADIKHDLTKPLPYPDSSVDMIYSSHLIEHFSRSEWDNIREDWMRVLKPSGTIEIHCPDIEICMKKYLKEPEEHWMRTIYGDQSGEGQFHKNGFTFKKLKADFPTCTVTLLSPASNYDLHVLIKK